MRQGQNRIFNCSRKTRRIRSLPRDSAQTAEPLASSSDDHDDDDQDDDYDDYDVRLDDT